MWLYIAMLPMQLHICMHACMAVASDEGQHSQRQVLQVLLSVEQSSWSGLKGIYKVYPATHA